MFSVTFSKARKSYADASEPELLTDPRRSSEITYGFDRPVTIIADGKDLSKPGYTPVFGFVSELGFAYRSLVSQQQNPVPTDFKSWPIDVDSWPMEMKLVGDDEICLSTYWWQPLPHGSQTKAEDVDVYEIGRIRISVTEFKHEMLDFIDRVEAHILDLYQEILDPRNFGRLISDYREYFADSP